MVGIPVISGEIKEFFSHETNGEIFALLTGVKPPRTIISFFELLGSYIWGQIMGAGTSE